MGVIQGTANPEFISGAAKSSDDLVGLAGSDRYYFSGNWGNDRIIDSAGEEDTIYFEHDVYRYNTNIARAYNDDGSPSDDLVITYTDGALFTSVTVAGQFAAGQNGVIENVQYYGYKNLVIFGNIIRDGTVVGDPINGFLGDDRINGKAGDDSIYGSAGIDSLNGDTGNDYLDGGADNDVLSGGIGNDSLYGGGGKDTFAFNLGDGTDRIEDANSEDLINLEGITDVSNVRLVYNPGYQESYYDDDGNEIFYEYGQGYKVFYGSNDSIEISGDLPVVRLSDGSTLAANVFTGSALDDTALVGTSGNDVIRGQGGADLIDGRLGDDQAEGGEGGDTLMGSVGVDSLAGGAGNDQYRLEIGQGVEKIIDSEGADDRILFGAGILFKDLKLEVVGSDLVITHAAQDDRELNVTLTGANTAGGIESLYFADETAVYKWNGTAFTAGVGVPTVTAGPDIISGSEQADTYDALGGNDSIFGNGGDDILSGGAGDDVISGGLGADKLAGGLENDSLDGGAGADQLSGDAGDDILSGRAGNDILNGGEGNDTINGGDGVDQIDGGAGDDTLSGGAGADTMLGGNGADLLLGGSGNDRLVGGAGADIYEFQSGNGVDRLEDNGVDTTIRFDSSVASDSVRLIRTVGSGGTPGNGFTLFYGAKGDSIQIANELPNQVLLSDDSEFDTSIFTGTASNDVALFGTNAGDTVRGLAGNDLLDGLSGDDTLDGGGGNDILRGSAGSDQLLGGSGNDVYRLNAGQGGEIISDNAGTDQIVFDAGISFAGLSIAANGSDLVIRHGTGAATVNVTLAGQVGSGAIEQLKFEGDSTVYTWNGTTFAGSVTPPPVSKPTQGGDVIPGRDTDDVIDGLGGNDALFGGNGNDVLKGSSGDDFLVGGTGIDRLEGGAGNDNMDGAVDNDLLFGDNGDDFLKGGGGDDQLSGGAGFDRLFGGIGNDTLDGEGNDDLVRGGVGDDTVRGGAGNDNVDGGSGNDIVEGGTGDDLMAGGTGTDTLRGGDGADQLAGSFGDDILDGGGGDDELRGGHGDDMLDGGIGRDIAFFNGPQVNYQLAEQADGSLVVSHAAAGQIYGNDVLRNIEVLDFAGTQVAVS